MDGQPMLPPTRITNGAMVNAGSETTEAQYCILPSRSLLVLRHVGIHELVVLQHHRQRMLRVVGHGGKHADVLPELGDHRCREPEREKERKGGERAGWGKWGKYEVEGEEIPTPAPLTSHSVQA